MMGGMKWRVLTILSAVSLVLCAVVIAMWVGSYGRSAGFVRVWPGVRYYAVRSADGWLGVFQVSPAFMHAAPAMPTGPIRTVFVQNAARIVNVPHCAAAGLLVVGPGIWVWGYRRRRLEVFRRTHGRCVVCGYDLRASKERCPECGTAIPGGRTRQGRGIRRMRYRENEEIEDEAEDRELPDEGDMDQEDDSPGTEACPYCGKVVSELAEVCPHCRSYISEEDAPSGKPLWIVIGAVVCLVIVVLCWVL